MQNLYQRKPRDKSTYTEHKNRSFTDSRESYQFGACKKTQILRWNNRIPTQEFVLHFLKMYSAKEIREYRKKIFRVLTDNGLEAVVNIELTRGEDGKPCDRVHFTIITDDPRSEKELRQLLEMACERQGLVNKKDFCITYEKLNNGYWRFNYFTKYGKKYFYKVILFEKNLGLDKFYTIGKWFHKPQVQIWEDIKAFMAAKDGTDIEKTGSPDATDGSDDFDIPNTVDELQNELTLEADDLSDDVSVDGINIEFEKSYQLERYGVDLDEVTGGNESITRLYILGVGKFRKVSGAGWLCIDEFNVFCEPIQKLRIQLDYDCSKVGRTSARNKCSSDYHLPKAVRIRDRRHEWKRFRYSIAFRQRPVDHLVQNILPFWIFTGFGLTLLQWRNELCLHINLMGDQFSQDSPF